MKFTMHLLSKNQGTHSAWSSRWQVSEPSRLECLVPFVTIAMAICSPLSASQLSPLYFCPFYFPLPLLLSFFLPSFGFPVSLTSRRSLRVKSWWADTSEASTHALNPILW